VADLKQLTSSNTVMVLPAFETAPQRNETLAHELADSAAAMNKTELQRLVDRKLVYQFALYLFRQVSLAATTSSRASSRSSSQASASSSSSSSWSQQPC
jgi:hypothetical protein